MTQPVRDASGLSEVKLRPAEEKQSPFSIFTHEVPDQLITGVEETIFPPFNAITPDTTEISFMIPPFSKQYAKLNSFRSYGTGRILEIGENGTLKAPENTVDLSVVNSLPTAMWDKVSVRLNDFDIDKAASQSYAYKVRIFFNILNQFM